MEVMENPLNSVQSAQSRRPAIGEEFVANVCKPICRSTASQLEQSRIALGHLSGNWARSVYLAIGGLSHMFHVSNRIGLSRLRPEGKFYILLDFQGIWILIIRWMWCQRSWDGERSRPIDQNIHKATPKCHWKLPRRWPDPARPNLVDLRAEMRMNWHRRWMEGGASMNWRILIKLVFAFF